MISKIVSNNDSIVADLYSFYEMEVELVKDVEQESDFMIVALENAEEWYDKPYIEIVTDLSETDPETQEEVAKWILSQEGSTLGILSDNTIPLTFLFNRLFPKKKAIIGRSANVICGSALTSYNYYTGEFKTRLDYDIYAPIGCEPTKQDTAGIAQVESESIQIHDLENAEFLVTQCGYECLEVISRKGDTPKTWVLRKK